MTNDEIKRCAAGIRHDAAARDARPMTARDRLAAAWLALVECRYALEGSLRGWRC